MSKRILITGPLLGDGANRLPDDCDVTYAQDEVMTQDQFAAAACGYWGILSMAKLKVDRDIFDSAPDLKIVSNFAVGYDNIDHEYAASKGVMVTNTPDVLTESTAEMGIALMLAASRRVVEADRFSRAGKFTGWQIDLMLGRQLHGKTLGIIGCGRIGQAVARMAGAFAMRVVYHNRSRLDSEIEDRLQLDRVSFDQLVRESDFVIITAPLNEQNRHLFTLEAFERMKRDAVLVNIGRGQIIKEDDLVTALQKRLIRAAALDVLETPTAMAPGLADCDNVTLTPHLGSATKEARTAMCDLAINALIDAYHGRRPRYVVND